MESMCQPHPPIYLHSSGIVSDEPFQCHTGDRAAERGRESGPGLLSGGSGTGEERWTNLSFSPGPLPEKVGPYSLHPASFQRAARGCRSAGSSGLLSILTPPGQAYQGCGLHQMTTLRVWVSCASHADPQGPTPCMASPRAATPTSLAANKSIRPSFPSPHLKFQACAHLSSKDAPLINQQISAPLSGFVIANLIKMKREG